MTSSVAQIAPANRVVSRAQVAELIARIGLPENYRNKRVLAIVPDGTRTAPVGLVFQELHRHIGEVTRALDVMIALGTHQPMSEEAVCLRLEISLAERKQIYHRVRFFNHAWNDPASL